MPLLRTSLFLLTVSVCFGADPTCSSQDLAEGSYTIHSSMNDNRCLDKATQNTTRIQFYFCTGGASQKFTFLTIASGAQKTNGCYLLKNYQGGLLGVDGSADPYTISSPAYGYTAAWWQVQKNGDGTHTLLCVKNCGLIERGCMDRRNPDDEGRAQVIKCSGVAEQKYLIK